MHNINYIRDNPIEFDNYMKSRGEKPIANKVISIDKDKREAQTVHQKLLAERNLLSKVIGKLRSEKKDSASEMAKVEELKNNINSLKELELVKNDELKAILSRLPNVPDKTTPVGFSEEENVFYKNVRDILDEKNVEDTMSSFEDGDAPKDESKLTQYQNSSILNSYRAKKVTNKLSVYDNMANDSAPTKHTSNQGSTKSSVI